MSTFNLVDSPFIPCETATGHRELGLRQVLIQAHEILEIRDASPVVTMALHRLLLAILHRLFGPADAKQWKALWDAKRFPLDPILGYIERWRDRFDLFDNQRPFFQDAPFKAKQPSGVNRLVREFARGHNDTLFDHTTDAPPPRLPPAVVARALIAEQAFAVGGGNSDLGYTSNAPLIGGIAVLILGDNLFQSLLLNLVRYPHDDTFVTESDEDAPVWERDIGPRTGTGEPAGYVDYLTWQSRTIRIHPEPDGLVQRVSYAQGRRYAPAQKLFDPMMAYQRQEKGDRPIHLQETKALWRDSAALFQFAENKVFRGPRALAWIHDLIAGGYLSRAQRSSLAAIGLCTDKKNQAKVHFWRHETLPLPLDYLADNQLVQSLKAALGMAEEVGRALRYATGEVARKILAPGEMPADKDRVWATVDAIAAERLYWSQLEVPFRQFLVELPGDAEHQKRRIDVWFTDLLASAAWSAFDASAGQLDQSARALRAVVAGRTNLAKSLATIARQANIQRPQTQGVSP
jgi:CRISPR system Cascade subunit CasA